MLHFILHSASNVSLFQLQKVGLSSSLPICTRSTPAPSPASLRSAHSTLTCSPVLRLTPLALPLDPTSSPPRCIQPCVCLPFSVFLQLTFPQRPWPVDGGEANPPAAVPPSLILTGSSHKLSMLSHIECIVNKNTSSGHEDGKVKVWLSRHNSLRLLTALDTARCFFLGLI